MCGLHVSSTQASPGFDESAVQAAGARSTRLRGHALRSTRRLHLGGVE
jgi:hypothetical protein